MVVVETVQGQKHEYPNANGAIMQNGLLIIIEELAVVTPISADPKSPGPSQAQQRIHASYVGQHVVRFYQAADDPPEEPTGRPSLLATS